jgi:hypothetical protein
MPTAEFPALPTPILLKVSPMVRWASESPAVDVQGTPNEWKRTNTQLRQYAEVANTEQKRESASDVDYWVGNF